MTEIPPDLADAIELGCGARADAFGAAGVEAAAREAMARLGVGSVGGLARALLGNPEELRAFCESLCVPETWFFRQPESFDMLAELAAGCGGFMRVLCAPCSVGCEAYSIAAVLERAGVDFEIDAVDFSEKFIEAARSGEFGKGCFRSKRAADFGYFAGGGGRAKMPESLSKRIRFRAADILSEGSAEGKYDVIFCRNLAIYLSARAKRRLFDRLLSLAADGAVIFCGHADGFADSDPRFERAGPARAFAVRAARTGEARKLRKIPNRETAAKPRGLAEMSAAGGCPGAAAENFDSDIRSLRALADRGLIGAAREKCSALLCSHPDSPGLNLLAAQIFSASADLENAEKYFRRALYLDPGNADASLGLKLVRRRLAREA